MDDRYHQANAKVATITGITTTSMIAVELIRRSRSADAIGPCGSRTPLGAQEARKGAAPTTDQRSRHDRRERHGRRAARLIEIGCRAARRQQAISASNDSTRCLQALVRSPQASRRCSTPANIVANCTSLGKRCAIGSSNQFVGGSGINREALPGGIRPEPLALHTQTATAAGRGCGECRHQLGHEPTKDPASSTPQRPAPASASDLVSHCLTEAVSKPGTTRSSSTVVCNGGPPFDLYQNGSMAFDVLTSSEQRCQVSS